MSESSINKLLSNVEKMIRIKVLLHYVQKASSNLSPSANPIYRTIEKNLDLDLSFTPIAETH